MAKKLQAKIEEQGKNIEELKLTIQNLKDSLENEKKQAQTTFQTKELEWKESDTIKTTQHESQINELNVVVDSLKEEVKNKQEQLDIKELKKLATSFSEQEEIHRKDQKNWLIALISVAVLLIFYAIFSIFLTSDKTWADRIGYYAIDIILISAVWFCSTQFSETTKLRYDYGNRKTLAQSFHNILNNLAEDISIKTKFIEKTTDVLCAPVGSGTKDPILTKKVLKDAVEIIGSVTNK